MALVFKLEYRLEFKNATSGAKETRDFVIGWCLYVPQLISVSNIGAASKPESEQALREGEVQLDLLLGPGMTLFGDVLWDQSLVRKDKKL